MLRVSSLKSLFGGSQDKPRLRFLQSQMRQLFQQGHKLMQIDMRRLRHGKKLCLLLGLLALNSCRSSQPPGIEICILDGYGGADCIETNGTKLYKSPSALLDYWATNETDESNYTQWCYDINAQIVNANMKQIKKAAIDE